jgi:hypothetical protein
VALRSSGIALAMSGLIIIGSPCSSAAGGSDVLAGATETGSADAFGVVLLGVAGFSFAIACSLVERSATRSATDRRVDYSFGGAADLLPEGGSALFVTGLIIAGSATTAAGAGSPLAGASPAGAPPPPLGSDAAGVPDPSFIISSTPVPLHACAVLLRVRRPSASRI